MSDFTIKVFSGPLDQNKPTDVETVGSQLKILAEQIASMPESSHPDINRSSKLVEYDFDANNMNEASETAVETLYKALSFVNWDGDAIKSQHGRQNSATFDKAREDVKLVFVFEEDGQMVVPVPSISQINRGVKNAPLKLPSVYDQFISDNSITELVAKMRTISSGGDNNIFSSFTDPQWADVEALLRSAAKAMRDKAEDEPNKSKTFYAQLGDYSVRQCHS